MPSSEQTSPERPASAARSAESFLVGTRVRSYIAAQGLKVADDAVDELGNRVREMVDEAIGRTKANKRLTVRPHDF